MGRRIVIKDADFSQCSLLPESLTWLLNYSDATLHNTGNVSSGNMFYIRTDSMESLGITGNTIKYVKIYCNRASSIDIASVSVSGTSSSIISSYTYNVTAGVNVITLREPITLSSSRSIGFRGNGIITYGSIVGWTFRRVGTTSDYSGYFTIDLGI